MKRRRTVNREKLLRRRNRRRNPRGAGASGYGPNTWKFIGIAVAGVLVWDYLTGSIGIFRMFGVGASGPGPLNAGNATGPIPIPPVGSGASSTTAGTGAQSVPPASPTPGRPQERPNLNPGASSTPATTPPYTPPPPPAHFSQPEYVNRVEQFRQSESLNPAYYRQRLIAAAKGEAGSVDLVSAAGVKFNADQWGWFRSQDGGEITTVDLFPADNRDYQMTITEYLQRRDAAGLTGLAEVTKRHPNFYLM